MEGPTVDAHGVTFRFDDPGQRLAGVSLYQEVSWPRPGPDLAPCDGGWAARLPRPDVDRMEYAFELLHRDGSTELVCDPRNPKRAPGAFGDKSVVEFPEYHPPDWLSEPPAAEGKTEDLPDLNGVAVGRLWSSYGSTPDEALPLLVVHDGIEYADFSSLLMFLDRMIEERALPPMRAALLHPVARDEQYSASPEYAEALAHLVLPRLHRVVPVRSGRRFRVGIGASLGALAMLHAHIVEPAAFGGLFLQSGSFFHHRWFRYDMPFEHFERIRRFVDRVHASTDWTTPVPVTITCGRVEMNFSSNRALALRLRAHGYPVEFRAVPDAHSWVGWRDAWTPGLVDLLRKLWL
jgi:enterochelin esterase family protein